MNLWNLWKLFQWLVIHPSLALKVLYLMVNVFLFVCSTFSFISIICWFNQILSQEVQKSEQQFTDWIKDHIKCAELANKQLIFIVKGQRICVASFCALYGISEYKFHLAEETLNKPTLHKAKGKTTINKWKAFLQTWFLNLVVSFCDLMPNSDSQYLPIYFTKTSLYNMAVQEYQDSEGSTFSQSSFFSFWKEHHKVIKIPKNLKMGQCDTCLELKRLKVSGISKTELATKVSEHNILQSKA